MPLPPLRPISKNTMQDRAYQQMKQALMSGAFAPGQSVTLRGVATQLGTSAMPIRDAIRRLVSDQALEMPTRRSIRVPLMSLARYESVLSIRKLLEGEAAALAAERVTKLDIEALAALNSVAGQALEANDMPRLLAANREFHFAVYQLAGDALLLSWIEKLWILSGPYLSLLMNNENGSGLQRPSLRDHEVLLKALRAGNSDRARATVVLDIETAAGLYRSRIHKVGEPKRGKLKSAGRAS